jgi:hypothetical protein
MKFSEIIEQAKALLQRQGRITYRFLKREWQQQGKHHAARHMLTQIYSWFTEGSDTKDLQEAKALLEELK